MTEEIKIREVLVACPRCHGSGGVEAVVLADDGRVVHDTVRCPDCDGIGTIMEYVPEGEA